MKHYFLLFVAAVLTVGCAQKTADKNDFVRVENGHFVRAGKPYYYVGTNFWYGAILGSEGQGGNRERLAQELDAMKRMGIDNLRILVGSDGERGVKTKVEPTLQEAPGVYNDTILAGLDWLLQEMGKRDMVAVLYLNNSWEWSGGYGFYLEHAGAGKQPRPDDAGYPAFMQAMSKYATNEKAHQLFYDYVRFIIGRTNRYTGLAYKDDPAIMSHLISIGSEGSWGCENDYGCWERICSDQNVDYCNVHLWPYNWGWAKPDSLIEHLPRACENTKEYINKHLAICDRIGKPLVMEEFGYPRDGFSFAQGSPTTGRDGYYRYVFSLVADNAEQGGKFHEQWQVGDDYTGDPAQEAQGLNSVFANDSSTLAVVREQVDRMNKVK